MTFQDNLILSINRIILEFKVIIDHTAADERQSINRIILEFKDLALQGIYMVETSINRIILEFKAGHSDRHPRIKKEY